MGVKVGQKLKPRRYEGTTFGKHEQLCKLLDGAIVAIDGTQWAYQSMQNARNRSMMETGPDKDAQLRSAQLLCCDRITQILRYGGHAVMVLDGQMAEEKAKSAKARGSTATSSSYPRVPGPNTPFGVVIEICEAMGVPCIVAPEDGEAMCAALAQRGLADLVWTTDVIDATLFGAKAIMKACKASHTNEQALVFRQPHTSHFDVVDDAVIRDLLGMPGAPAIGVAADVSGPLVVLSALIGTDFNPGGLKQFGEDKANAFTTAMYEIWLERSNASGEEDVENDFVEFVCDAVAHSDDTLGTSPAAMSLSKKPMFPLFVKKSREHESVVCSGNFADELRYVRDTYARIRNAAVAATQTMSRDKLLWDHGALSWHEMDQAMERLGSTHAIKSGSDPISQRIMVLLAERMVRLGEQGAQKSALRLTSVVKTRPFNTKNADGDAEDHDDDDGGAADCFYYYLANVELATFPGPAASKNAALVQEFLRVKLAKDAGARVVRARVMEAQFPSALADFRQRLADKAAKDKDKADRKAKREERAAGTKGTAQPRSKPAASSGTATITTFFSSRKPSKPPAEAAASPPSPPAKAPSAAPSKAASAHVAAPSGASAGTATAAPRRPPTLIALPDHHEDFRDALAARDLLGKMPRRKFGKAKTAATASSPQGLRPGSSAPMTATEALASSSAHRGAVAVDRSDHDTNTCAPSVAGLASRGCEQAANVHSTPQSKLRDVTGHEQSPRLDASAEQRRCGSLVLSPRPCALYDPIDLVGDPDPSVPQASGNAGLPSSGTPPQVCGRRLPPARLHATVLDDDDDCIDLTDSPTVSATAAPCTLRPSKGQRQLTSPPRSRPAIEATHLSPSKRLHAEPVGSAL